MAMLRGQDSRSTTQWYSDALEFVVRYALDDLVDMIAMDSSVLVSSLTLSAHLGLLRVGKQVHGHIVALGTAMMFGYVQQELLQEEGLSLLASLYREDGLAQMNCYTLAIACSRLSSVCHWQADPCSSSEDRNSRWSQFCGHRNSSR